MKTKYPIPGKFFDEHEVVDLGKQGVWDIVFTDSPDEHDDIIQSSKTRWISPGKWRYNKMELGFKWMPITEFVNIQTMLVMECEYDERACLSIRELFDAFVSSADLDWVRSIQKEMIAGSTFPSFFLEYFIGGTIIPFQEGRHRSLAALWNGVKKVPVWIFNKPPDWSYADSVK